jgi:CRISPR-associated protein Csm4
MDCYIVYLQPKGAGGYKAELRSDTLWASICWAIRAIFGEEALEQVLNAYGSADPAEAFYLSSAFPYQQEEGGDKVCFFPNPLLPFRPSEPLDIEGLTPDEIKIEARRYKRRIKRQDYIAKSHFEYLTGGHSGLIGSTPPPETISRPMTHNTISRLTGSTLSIKAKVTDKEGSGQLFHTDELYLKGEDTGFFFLLQGNLEKVAPALRYMQYEGLGGDRSTGKGRFDISEPQAYVISTPADANALVNLSLYHPTRDELESWRVQDKRLLNYKLEDRLGRVHLQKQYLHDKPLLFFKEGSVFPQQVTLDNSQSIYGQNVITGRHSAGFDIRRYGYGFMVNMKIS